MTLTLGQTPLLFHPHEDWLQLPDDVQLTEAIGVTVDRDDNVYIFNRGDPPVIVLNREGRYRSSWGSGAFVRPHGIWYDAPSHSLFTVDDMGHGLQQFTTDGQHLRTIGPSNVPSDTGATGFDYREIRQSAPPFNLPTNAVVAPSQEIYVTDGYGNCRLHCFSGSGELAWSVGEPGTGPAEFQVPHGLAIDDDGRLLVCDRENSRIQLFDSQGRWLECWEDVLRPCQAYVWNSRVYVAELGWRAGLFPWYERQENAAGGRLSIFDLDGSLLCRWGTGDDPESPGDFYAPHDICVDSRGTIYLAEVAVTAAGLVGIDATRFPTLRVFHPA